MERSHTIQVDVVRDDLVIRFADGTTALLSVQDIYDLAVERHAFVADLTDEADSRSETS